MSADMAGQLEDLDALAIVEDLLLVAAQRYVAACERSDAGLPGMSASVAARGVADAAQKHAEAFRRCTALGVWDSREDEPV